MAESKDGKIIRQYIRNPEGQLLGLKIGEKYYNYHLNYRGDVIGITDFSGNIQASYTYDSWGNVLKEDVKDASLKEQPFRYASYFYDKESDQYYLMARYYHPKQGVFLSVDPELSDDETVEMNNAYSYGANNPVMKFDSSGKWPWLIPVAIAAYKIYKLRKKIKKVYRTTKYFAKKTYRKVYKNVRKRYIPKKIMNLELQRKVIFSYQVELES